MPIVETKFVPRVTPLRQKIVGVVDSGWLDLIGLGLSEIDLSEIDQSGLDLRGNLSGTEGRGAAG